MNSFSLKTLMAYIYECTSLIKLEYNFDTSISTILSNFNHYDYCTLFNH